MGTMACVASVPLVAIINGSVRHAVCNNLVGVNTVSDGTAKNANGIGIQLRP